MKTIHVTLTGLRPLMFDRYAGDNNTQLDPEDKLYRSTDGTLVVPALNLFSLLSAENTKSVCRQFFGKKGKTHALGIKAFCNIQPDEIPILDDDGPIKFTGFNDQVYMNYAVARVKGGVPNPKARPCLALPWRLEFQVQHMDNSECTLPTLRSALELGGTLGIGTFRPFFGRYKLSGWKVDD